MPRNDAPLVAAPRFVPRLGPFYSSVYWHWKFFHRTHPHHQAKPPLSGVKCRRQPSAYAGHVALVQSCIVLPVCWPDQSYKQRNMRKIKGKAYQSKHGNSVHSHHACWPLIAPSVPDFLLSFSNSRGRILVQSARQSRESVAALYFFFNFKEIIDRHTAANTVT